MKLNRKPTHKQVLAELMKKPRITEAAKETHGDIEDAIEQAGGRRGALRHA